MAQYPEAVIAAQTLIDDSSHLDNANCYCVCVHADDLPTLMDGVNVLIDANWTIVGGITANSRSPQYLAVLVYEAAE